MFYWLITILSLLGVILNIHGYRSCFAIWIITSATWAIVDYRHGLPQQAALQGVYFLLNLYGIWKWGRPPSQTGSTRGTTTEISS